MRIDQHAWDGAVVRPALYRMKPRRHVPLDSELDASRNTRILDRLGRLTRPPRK
jgi:hypothetical protein